MIILKTYLLWCSIVIISAAACHKLDVPSGTPSCIKDKINAIKEEERRDPPGSVWRYDYNGETVYFIPSYCCDIPSELYDEKCNFICSPDGGITGAGDGQCTDFFNKRTNEQLIWKDTRKF